MAPRLLRPLTLALIVAGLAFVSGCSQRAPSEPACACPDEPTVVDPTLLAFLSKARAAHHQADLDEGDKKLDEAVRALLSVVDGPRPGGPVPPPEAAEVIADTRARIADLKSQLGAIDPALREIDEGLLLATRPTHFRGHLFEVKGLVLERQMAQLKEKGDAPGAERAKTAAIKAYDEAIEIQNKVIESALPGAPPGKP